MKVLCLNRGSSSLKAALIEVRAGGLTCLERREIVAPKSGAHDDTLAAALKGIPVPHAIGHRLVHGGPDQTAPLRLVADARRRLDSAIPFAPLHLPMELETVDAALALFPGVPQVACFDTAFHSTLPAVARRLPLAAWADAEGVRSYGFHGLSCEYVVSRLGGSTLGDSIIAHLGSGASMTAVRGGRSIDTTMGMSPTGGLMMGTRSGDLDPGVLVYLIDQKGWSARDVEQFVNHECGLLGVSGTASDMKALLRARDHDERARLAVELFVYVARKEIGALAAALGGLRSLVFTGGMGEHSAVVRSEIAAGLDFLGVSLDEDRNGTGAAIVSREGSPCTVFVVVTDEESVIARHVEASVSPG